MSTNKYKNNEPLNQKVKNQPVGEALNQEIADDNIASSKNKVKDWAKEEEAPELLSKWVDPVTEKPLPEANHPEINRIPIDYKDQVKLTQTGPVDGSTGPAIPGEKKYYPDAAPRTGARTGECMPNESKPILDDGTDQTESMESRYYSEPINPYTGEKPYDEELVQSTGGPIDRRPLKQKGFPWWWILLPLILLALIYGLTRPPATSQPQPSSTTSFVPEISNFVISAASPESIYFTIG